MVNSLSCAKVSHVNFTEVTAVNRAEVNAAVAVSAAVGSANHNQFASNNVMLSASNPASNPGNATSSNSPGLHEDDKTATVKMEVLDDLFGPGYGWPETADNNITAASTVASTAAAFSSLLMSPTSSSVATSKCTVKVPTESDFQASFSPQPPNLSAISLAAAAAMINEQPLRVVIPSPLPAGPDTTTATNSPIAAGASKTPVMAPTTPSSGSAASVAAASSSGKKTVFTAKGT